jgi:hypothetical protein
MTARNVNMTVFRLAALAAILLLLAPPAEARGRGAMRRGSVRSVNRSAGGGSWSGAYGGGTTSRQVSGNTSRRSTTFRHRRSECQHEHRRQQAVAEGVGFR